MAGIYNIYSGPTCETIDWDNPVATCPDGQPETSIHMPLPPGAGRVFAARRVSAEGVEEHNLCAVARVEMDDQGELLPPPVGRPAELAATAYADGTVVLSFSFHVRPGFASPECFEVFSDDGSGTIDFQIPAAVVPSGRAGTEEFQALLSLSALPAMFAVRARSKSRVGPLSRTAIAPGSPAPTPPETI